MKRIFALLIALMMVFALAACGEKTPSGGTDNPGGSQTTPGGDTADGWFSASNLSSVGLTGLSQPAGTTIKSSSATNVKLNGMTDANYKAWVAGAFALITEKNGGVYEAETDSAFKLVGYKKIASLTAGDVSTDELPSFDLVYKVGEKVYSLYILYYPVAYRGESAGYAEVRIADMTSEWGKLPFNNATGGNGGGTETKDTLVMEIDHGAGIGVLTDTYYFTDGKAVSKSGTLTCSTTSLAQTQYDSYSGNPLYENVRLDGLTLSFDYSELGFTSFKGKDKAYIKSIAEAMGAVEKTN